ncbi:MAG TPA: LysR substrate-binding domain-containing protein, partial [Kiloniellales bacterium]|nr:LysR substrate-binding domain-containing protein [Kiloniellales bacterium]
CGDALRAGHLVRVLPDWGETEVVGIFAVYPASRNLSPKVRVFVDWLVERFAGVPYWDRDLEAPDAAIARGAP